MGPQPNPTLPAVATTAPPAQVMAGGSPQAVVATAPADPTAKSRAIQFGGNPGGRPRKDGFAPGSPEAIAADREKERLKKERQRSRQRAENPPALPSTISAAGPAAAGATEPLAGAEGGALVAAAVAPLAWMPEDFRELADELIPLAEQHRVQKRTAKAAKAKLPPPLLKEIEKDSRWDEVTKKTLAITVPRLSAKYMNMSGVSAKWKDEGVLAVCLVRLWRRESSLDSKLDKIIEQNEALLKQSQAKEVKP